MAGQNIDTLNVKITANADSAIKSLQGLTAILAQFNQTIQITDNSSRNIGNHIGDLNIVFGNLTINTNKAKSSAQGLGNTFKGLVNLVTSFASGVKALGVGIITTFTTSYAKAVAFKNLIMPLVNLSNKYVEDYNLFTVSLGEYAEEAERYANQVSDIMGIDPAAWMRNQGVFNTIIKGFGVATDRAYLMSQQLTQLGYDISSFYNIDVEEAMTKLTSGISGELEPLRRLGYDLSKARLEQEKANVTFSDSKDPIEKLTDALTDEAIAQEALNHGITKSVADMNQAEKAQLRYFAIMTQVKDAQGDMSRTLEAPANQLRVFNAQLQMAGRSIGNIFIPALNKMLPYVIATTKAIRTLADWLAALVGYKFPEIDYSSTNTVAQIEDVEDAWDNATKKVKEFKKFLLGIDELNIIPSTNPSGRGNKGDDSAGWRDFDLPTYDFLGDAAQSRVNEIYEKIIELFKNHSPEEIGDTIKDWIVNGLNSIDWSAVQAQAYEFGANFAKFLNGLLAPSTAEEDSLGASLGKGIGGIFGTLTSGISGFKDNAKIDEWAKTIGEFFSKALENTHIDLDNLFSKVDNEGNKLSGIAEWIGGELSAMKDNPLITAGVILSAAALGKLFGDKFYGSALVAIGAYGLGSLFSKWVDESSGDEHWEGGIFAQLDAIKESLTDGSWKEAGAQWIKDIFYGVDAISWTFHPAKILDTLLYEDDEDIDLDAYDSILDMLTQIKDTFGDGSWADALLDWGKEIWKGLNAISWDLNPIQYIEKFLYWLAGYEPPEYDDWFEHIEAAVEDLQFCFMGFKKDWDEDIAEIKENATSLWNKITTVSNGIKEDFGLVVDSFKNRWETIKETSESATSYVSGKLQAFRDDVKDFLQPIVDLIARIGSSFESLSKLDFSSLGGKLNLGQGGEGLLDWLFKKNSYATGGFPEDGLFFANHGEMIGQFSNGRTAVANNDQIVAGISEGVRSAVISALASSGIVEAVMSGKSINIDGREIMNVVVNQNNRAINRTGVSPIRT